jgi:hypothetical protein
VSLTGCSSADTIRLAEVKNEGCNQASNVVHESGTFSLKYLFTKEPRMVVKMRRQLSSDMSVMDNRLKWRSMRLVMGLRPPPGGPMAATNWVSMICLKAHGGLLSYHPCSVVHVLCAQFSLL